jgi:predicted nucleotidyltransferase
MIRRAVASWGDGPIATTPEAAFDRFMGLKLDLEDLVGRPVDLLTPECLRPVMQAEIEEEAIRVA